MTSDEKLVGDIRAYLAGMGAITEVSAKTAAAMRWRGRGARPMEMRGRVMEGYVYVDPATLDMSALKTWLDEAWLFCEDLAAQATEQDRAERKTDIISRSSR